MKKKLAITFDKNKIILLILSLICYELALYAIALHRQTKWQKGKVAIDMKFTAPYTVRLEGNLQLQSISRSNMKLGASRFRTIPRRNNVINM